MIPDQFPFDWLAGYRRCYPANAESCGLGAGARLAEALARVDEEGRRST